MLGLLGLAAGCSTPDTPPAQATAAQLAAWGDRRLDRGDPEGAVAAFRMAMQRDSLQVRALAGLARAYQVLQRPQAADLYRRRAFHIHYDAGLSLLEAGSADSARSRFQEAAQVMPGHPLAHLRLGDLCRAAGQLDSAIAHYERAVTANPRYAEAQIALGRSCAASGQTAQARRAFERAIEANVNAIDAYLGLGRLLSQQREWASAAEQFDKALLIDPRSALAREGLQQARTRL